ncbi:MAG: hypothetical protein U0414_01720 [Polyangiaceae bacterium]
MRRAAAILAIASASLACGSQLPSPRLGPHANDLPKIVPFPPPPVRVDVVGPPPSNAKDLVWIDGQWIWSVSRWTWQHGAWAEQRAGEHYAPPVFYRNPNDELLWFEGRFIDARGNPVSRAEAK